MHLIRKVISVFDRTISFMAVLAGILLIFALLIVVIGIVARYFLSRPIGWVPEIAGYVLLYLTFLTAAWILKGEAHVRVDLVLERVKPRTRVVLNIITSIISAAVCLIVTGYALKVTWDLYRIRYFTPTVLEFPKFILTAIIFVGVFLLLIQFLRRTYGYLESRRTLRDKEG